MMDNSKPSFSQQTSKPKKSSKAKASDESKQTRSTAPLRPYKCDYCDMPMASMYVKKRHENDNHNNPTIFECRHPGCKHTSKREHVLRAHLKAKHGGHQRTATFHSATYCYKLTDFVQLCQAMTLQTPMSRKPHPTTSPSEA